MLNGTYAYRFLCGPTPAKVNVTIHAFHENGLASVAEISRDSLGKPTKVGFVLTLNEWALDPRDVEAETVKEVANA